MFFTQAYYSHLSLFIFARQTYVHLLNDSAFFHQLIMINLLKVFQLNTVCIISAIHIISTLNSCFWTVSQEMVYKITVC